MLCLSNSTRKKTFTDFSTLHRLRWHLKEIVDYCDLVMEEVTEGKVHATITSTIRNNSRDHSKGNAVDLRSRDLTLEQREEVESKVNDRYPVPSGQRSTIKFYDKQNSGYDPHAHVRVEHGSFKYPLCDCADPAKAGSLY